jgi:uncharacterized SAM-binding protein YcdF (DUF218 family)
MISPLRNMAGSDTLEAADALGWGWTDPMKRTAPVRRRWLKRALLACLGLAGLGALAGFVGFLTFVYSLDRVERRPEVRTEGIVALTGGAQRIGDAIDLLAQGYATRLLISGVNERTSREEIARLNPGQRKLFDCCVDLDYRARNTIGNAIETRRWTVQNRFRSLIVVTSSYHMPRTLVELDHALPGVRKVPYAVVTPTVDPDLWWRSLATARVLLSEYAKLVIVWVRTRIEADPEQSTAAMVMSGGPPAKLAAEPVTR